MIQIKHPHLGQGQLSSLLILTPKNKSPKRDKLSQFLEESQKHIVASGDTYASHNIDHTLYGAPQYQ